MPGERYKGTGHCRGGVVPVPAICTRGNKLLGSSSRRLLSRHTGEESLPCTKRPQLGIPRRLSRCSNKDIGAADHSSSYRGADRWSISAVEAATRYPREWGNVSTIGQEGVRGSWGGVGEVIHLYFGKKLEALTTPKLKCASLWHKDYALCKHAKVWGGKGKNRSTRRGYM